MDDVDRKQNAPSPKRKPSAKRVLALWKTQALSVLSRKCRAVSSLLVMMESVCELPNVWMCETASSTSSTSSMQQLSAPYSVCMSVAGGGPNLSLLRSFGPANTET